MYNAIDELRLDVLAITETWIKADHPAVIKSDSALLGFTVLHTHRPSDHNGGGVAVVAKEALNTRPISLSDSYSSCEFLAVQLTVKTSRLNFVSVYRPPQTSSFFEDFRNFLDEVVDLSGGLYICGDVNCPSITTGHIDRHLEQVIDDFDLIQHVSVPTHNLGGLLDVVINSPKNPTVIGITINDLGISDHSIVTTSLSTSSPQLSCLVFNSRHVKGINLNTFSAKLLSSSVHTTLALNTNEFANQLHDDVVHILDDLAPMRRMKKRCGKPLNRWLSSEAVAAQRNRRQLERRYRRTDSEAVRQSYSAACRNTNRLIRESRRQHCVDKLVATDGNSHRRWQVIKELLHADDHSTNSDAVGSQSMCDEFSTFFTNKIANISHDQRHDCSWNIIEDDD